MKQTWVIQHHTTHKYWHKQLGWVVSKQLATRFDWTQHMKYRLPIGGCWLG